VKDKCILGGGIEEVPSVPALLLSAAFKTNRHDFKSRDSSVGIALGYALDDRCSRVRFLAGAVNFFLHHRVENGCVAHPASYLMDTGRFFPWDKAAEE
jgi:hypothetical protein